MAKSTLQKVTIGLLVIVSLMLSVVPAFAAIDSGSPFSSTDGETHADRTAEDGGIRTGTGTSSFWTQEQWSNASGSQRATYCGNNPTYPECQSIRSEQGSCFYENPDIITYDTIYKNCRLDPQEECLQKKDEAIAKCVGETTEESNPYKYNLCREKFSCRFVQGSYTLVTQDAGVPYDSEYFDVTDKERGLSVKGQASPLTNEELDGGPIVIVLNRFTNLLVTTIGIFALIVFLYGGILFITANGDDNKITKGKGAIKYSLIGIVFAMLSYTIVVLVQSIFF